MTLEELKKLCKEATPGPWKCEVVRQEEEGWSDE